MIFARSIRQGARTLAWLLAFAAAATVISTASRNRGGTPTSSGPPRTHGLGAAPAALRELNALRVVSARPHHGGYQRGCGRVEACSFGPAWTDDTTAPGAHNGCDTRDDILRTQLTHVAYRAGSRCVVTAGVLHDPYTGHCVAFAKQHASVVQIDHVVPLALAWDLGAYAWPLGKREVYANDEARVLLAVSGPVNEAKGDSGPAEWMPPAAGHRATYAARIIAVLTAYRLPVTVADKTALTAALKGQ